MAGGRSQRSKLLVDRSIQGLLLVRFATHWCFFVLALFAFLFFVELVTGDPHQALDRALQRNMPTVLAVIALSPIFLYDLCKCSNRFVGPMVRLRQAVRDLADGKTVEPLKVREGDLWQDLFSDFQRIVDRVAARPLITAVLDGQELSDPAAELGGEQP